MTVAGRFHTTSKLREQGSNLRPSPYTNPTVTNRRGLYHLHIR